MVEARNSDPEPEARDGSATADEVASAQGPAQAEGLTEAVANVGDRVQEIIDTAERVAGDIRAEAEIVAARHLEEQRQRADRALEERMRELERVTRMLSTRAASVQRETSALTRELDDAVARMARFSGSDPLASVPVGSPERPEPEVHAYPGTAARERTSQQAILRATQMVVAGDERGEIERMLRTEFGVRDPAGVVEDMLRTDRA